MEQRIRYLEDLQVQQAAKALFFKKVSLLFDDDIKDDEVLDLAQGKHANRHDLPPIRVKTFCYSMRLFTCMSHRDWTKVSSTIDNYKIPLTLSGAKSLFIDCVDDALEMLETHVH